MGMDENRLATIADIVNQYKKMPPDKQKPGFYEKMAQKILDSGIRGDFTADEIIA